MEDEEKHLSPFSEECGKISHPSIRVAKENLRIMNMHLESKGRARSVLNAFKCDKCHGWHLGNSEPRLNMKWANKPECRQKRFVLEEREERQ